VHGNPVNATDPSGMMLLMGLMTVVDKSKQYVQETQKINRQLTVAQKVLVVALGGIVIAGTIWTIFNLDSIAFQIKLLDSKRKLRECFEQQDKDCELDIPIVFCEDRYKRQPLAETTRHIYDAISGNAIRGLPLASLLSATKAGKDQWYRGQEECNKEAREAYRAKFSQTGACDEYPFHASEQGGLRNYDSYRGKTVSLRLVPEKEAGPQGELMNAEGAMGRAGVVPNHPRKKCYGVIPLPGLPFSFWKPAKP